MRSSVPKGRLVKMEMRRLRLAYNSLSIVEHSAALPENFAGSGSGHAPVIARAPKSGQTWPSRVSHSAITKSICGADGPMNSSQDLLRKFETS